MSPICHYQIGTWSRWLTDLFGMDDDDDDSIGDKAETDNSEEKQNASLKSFSLLNALSDLLMLPKDMLLSASIRNEVVLAMKLNFSSCS